MPLLELNFFCHQRNELPMAQVRTFFPTPLLFFASFLRFFPNTSFLTLLDFLAFSRHSCRECSGFFLAPLSWQFFLASLSWLFWRRILALTTHPLGADVWEPIRVVDHETEHNKSSMSGKESGSHTTKQDLNLNSLGWLCWINWVPLISERLRYECTRCCQGMILGCWLRRAWCRF